jgi:hypothetical protein
MHGKPQWKNVFLGNFHSPEYLFQTCIFSF